ncbi:MULTISPECIES: cation diffusion facilitator family transporter [Nocardia]|uniref:Cation efflux protein n=1 Tax=Nocardia asteroides NBRC 15531 TaxID=1110697 RepID=U5EPL5_NOCAS|nr:MULTISPECIES: cation diffusion facilitator family transporter [Nocardia]TLF63339.1 cation transporter [Nocardia asteroides NBRC 15531]UGT47238.1 cation diffusion facilitator family transporter [Nocardia asteroides]SFM75265.1 cobalt-zinc-cadmium efflux system protein [Nocardia asteroides]VEG33875.1 Cadmium, cobalt and zinc/H(+)-K(+) antiporter [Nocardia asteroides]GAD87034.1 putative cation efflux protein [Nocardia asteroides NBRC 15531]
MGAGHGHSHGSSNPDQGSASSRYTIRLAIVIGLGLVTFVAQVVVGLSTSSLALLSDSAHVFTDVFGVTMALVAILIARHATIGGARSFGMYRAEVFAALFNAILLFGVAGWVLYEAVGRLSDPPEVPGLPVAVVAVVGLLMNVISMLILREGAKDSLNVRGAYLEVMADMLGSLGVLASGLITIIFGWRYADPAIGVAIGLFVLPRAFHLGRQALRILFQHAPAELDLAQIEHSLQGLDGVEEVHDLHVWTLTPGMEVASTHLVTNPDADADTVLRAAQQLLAESYHLGHATVQIEPGHGSEQCRKTTW